MSCTILLIVFFFFFKQKTAYEMRISDWSSDVCSSDLAAPKLYQAIVGALQADIASGRYAPGDRLPPERALVERFEVSRLTVREAMKIGRASCRESGGQYV